MRLSLKNFSLRRWPPLISHLCCLFIGMGLVTISTPPAQSLNPSIRGRVVISVKRELLTGYLAHGRAKPGMGVFWAKRSSPTADTTCILKGKRNIIIQTEPFLALALDPSDAPTIFKLIHHGDKRLWTLIGEYDRDSRLPFCHQAGEVTYGGRRS